jgi:hypothetical protein
MGGRGDGFGGEGGLNCGWWGNLSVKKAQLDWLKWNFALSVALYFGVYHNVILIGYVVMAFMWLMLASYLAVLYLGRLNLTRAVPVSKWLSSIFDAFVLVLLISSGWRVTGTVYALTCLALALIHYKSNKQSKTK